jgi:hypothetical protein
MFANVIEKRRKALQRLPWLRPVLLGINVILAIVGVFLIPVVGLIIGLGLIVLNELLTPVIFQRIFIKEFEGTLRTSGDLQRLHFSPLPVNEEVLAQHKQRSRYSCIPMSVEFVLKLLGKLPADDFSLQNAWGERRDGNFSDFDGQTINSVRFRKQFPQPRDDSFPLNDLFSTIENELASGKYVIISLAVPSLTNPGETDYHNYVIHNRRPNGEFEAVTKGREPEPEQISDVRERVGRMKGTDILTYELIDPSPER